jgi:DNA invertase Pin-like site-specific DNA recombinase
VDEKGCGVISERKFVAVDNPHANKLTVHILAAVAEHEREMISERTKAALQAAKARGVRLGNPQLARAAKRGVAAVRANVALPGSRLGVPAQKKAPSVCRGFKVMRKHLEETARRYQKP